MKQTKNDKLSAAEIQQLQQKVLELERTLHSIQSGGIDALIMKNKKGEASVFTLEGADEPYRILVESLSEGAITLNEEGNIIHCNKQFSKMVKNSAQHLSNTSFFEYIPTIQHGLLKDLLQQGKTKSCKGEFTLQAKDNSTKTVLLSCHRLKFGNVDGISMVATDITDLKKMQTDMNRAKEYYQVLMENASCGFVIHDKDGIIIDVNKQFEIIYGASRDKMIGTNLKEYCMPDERYYIDVQLQKILIEKKIGPNEIHVIQPSGKIRDIEFSAVYIDFENEKFIISIINDITNRNRFQSHALLNDKLSTIGILAAGIIHEINNPITWILTNLSYLKKKTNNLHFTNTDQMQLIAKFDEVIKETIQGTERIQAIIKDLKGFARIDELQVTTPIDIHETLNTAINMASPQFKNIARLEKYFSEDIPQLFLNRGKLHQVFLNLIINSIQSFSGEYDKNIIRIKTAKEKNRILIDITDNGCGISSEVIKNIFEPFFTTKPIGIGTGLGLSISNEIVNNEGGEIKVKSILGKGTTFSIYLPLQVQASSAALAKTIPTKAASRKRILVIDDEPTLLIVTKRILEKEHDVTTVLGGRKALTLLTTKPIPFDIIITDVNMPDVSGVDLYRYLSNDHSGLEDLIVFISGGSISPIVDTFLGSIKNPCIEKPFTPEQLRQTINEFDERIRI